MENILLKKLAAGVKPIGAFTGLASESVVELLGRTGLDFVIIDNEHSPVEAETSAKLIRAAENVGLCPLCRVREISRPAVLKLLDVGAQGLIVPNVHTVDEARELVGYAKFTPVGSRGYCPSRKDGWGFDPCAEGPISAGMAYQNRETLLIPQCETVGALEHIEEIAALPGVDGIFIGPFDLSISMGIPGEFERPEFKAALKRVLAACRAAGKLCILFTGTSEGVKRGFEEGYDAMTYSIDAMLIIESLKRTVDELRGGM